MKLTKVSMYSGIEHTMDLPISLEQLALWNAGGGLIQDIFPSLTPDQREFLMTGMTAEEFNEATAYTDDEE